MPNIKTKLDLHLAAAAYAQQSLDITDPMAFDATIIPKFQELAGGADADYPFFKQELLNRRTAYQQMRAAPAPSTIVAPAAPKTS